MNSLFNKDRPCTIQELEDILTAPSAGFMLQPSTAYDEVIDGIFIGEGDKARSVNCMKRLGVTHVLNAAVGKDMYHVNTNHVMYNRKGIEFLGIEATDFINCDLSKYFNKAADFIEAGLIGGGKVFVHCVQGISRSATLVLAYLMIKQHLPVQDAIRLVREKREICPNPGFLQQLCKLNEDLKKSGHFDLGKQQSPEADNMNKEEAKSMEKGQENNSTVVTGNGEAKTSVEPKADKKESSQADTKENEEEEKDKLCSLRIKQSNTAGNGENKLNRISHFIRTMGGKKTTKPCTVEELEDLLTEESGGLMMMPSAAFSQIDDSIYIGDKDLNIKKDRIERLKITHVLNAAYKKGVNSDPDLYKEVGVKFLGIEAEDTMTFDMTPFFDKAVDFIRSAVSEDGRVFVQCLQGDSRSATLVIAYFMIENHVPAPDAVKFVRQRREICPNANFLKQLCDLNEKLRKIGYFDT